MLNELEFQFNNIAKKFECQWQSTGSDYNISISIFAITCTCQNFKIVQVTLINDFGEETEGFNLLNHFEKGDLHIFSDVNGHCTKPK